MAFHASRAAAKFTLRQSVPISSCLPVCLPCRTAHPEQEAAGRSCSWHCCSLPRQSPSSPQCSTRFSSPGLVQDCFSEGSESTNWGWGGVGWGRRSLGLRPRENATAGTAAMLTVGRAVPLRETHKQPHSCPISTNYRVSMLTVIAHQRCSIFLASIIECENFQRNQMKRWLPWCRLTGNAFHHTGIHALYDALKTIQLMSWS